MRSDSLCLQLKKTGQRSCGLALAILVFTIGVFGVAGAAHATSYTDLIWNAAVKYNVSPYFLASRIRQEVCVGSGKSGSVSGNYNSSYIGIYNFYNIGATSGGDPILNGLNWAKNGTGYGQPWADPQKSISGGANFLASSYIAVGQDSKYLQKFNVAPSNPANLYSHQYMTNIVAPLSEANTTYGAYNGVGALQLGMVFYIPVYTGMPTLSGTPYTVTVGSVYLRNGASTTSPIIATLYRGSNVQVITWNYTTSGGHTWAKVMLGTGITGYMAQGDSSGAWLSAVSGSGTGFTEFPASYRPYLNALAAKYPKWTFKPLNTGLAWNTVLSNEQGGKSAYPAPGSSFVAAASNPMLKQPLAWVETGTWYQASQAAVAYYMDPRNLLSPSGVFAFEQLSFNSALHTQAGVQALIAGTFMAGTGPVTYINTSGQTVIFGAPGPSDPLTNVKVTPASVANGGSVTVSWTKVPGSTRYRIRLYRQNDDSTWTNISYGGALYLDYGDVSSVTLKGLTWAGTYKVLAYSGNVNNWYTPGTYSNVFTVSTPGPTVPLTNIVVSPSSIPNGGTANVTWTKVTGSTRYRTRLYRQNPDGNWTNIAIGGELYRDYGDVSTAAYSNLTWAGTYKVLAYSGNAGGWYTPGTYSNTFVVQAATTPPAVTPPTVPLTGVKVSPSSVANGGTATVTWTKVAGSSRYRTRLYRQNPDGNWTNIAIGGELYRDYGDVSTAAYSNLTWAGTYKVLAYSGNAAGWYTPGTYSNVFTISK